MATTTFCQWVASFVFMAAVAGANHNPSTPATFADLKGKPYDVTYDRRSFRINGEPILLLSGSVHYQRAGADLWDRVLSRARDNGLNTIQVYVFWNYHEHTRGEVDFSSTPTHDFAAFLRACAAHGLWVNLRIGPYVCSEWTWGGLPLWLQDIGNMSVRTFNPQFMSEMERWVQNVVAQARPFFADHGGPVLLYQLENEYNPFGAGNVDENFKYVDWVGNTLAKSLDLPVPLVMCNGAATGDTGAVESCNSCDCEEWVGSKHWNASVSAAELKLHGKQSDKPAMWTENWMGWNSRWTWSQLAIRPEDKAFATAAFIAAGGSYNNYYMWYSGNNYGYYAGPAITTSYGDNDVPMHNDGSPHEPMFTHLGRLHAAFQAVAGVMLCQDAPVKTMLAEVYAYEYAACGRGQSNTSNSSGSGVDFVLNRDLSAPAKLQFKGLMLTVAPMSLVMVRDGKIAYRTDDVAPGKYKDKGFRNAGVVAQPWKAWREVATVGVGDVVTADHAVEQLSLTNDTSPYMYYDVTLPSGDPAADLERTTHTLSLQTLNAQAFVVFLDDVFVADTYDSTDGLHSDGVVLGCNLTLSAGQQQPHRLSILSSSLGVPNFYPSDFCMWKGLAGGKDAGACRNHPDSVAGQGPPLLDGKPMEGAGWNWTMRPRLQGEWLNITANPEPGQASPVKWEAKEARTEQPKTWFESFFPTPANATGSSASVGVHLNLTGFGRGFAWVNGRNIGRFWSVAGSCDPPGAWNTFCEDFDDDFCDQPSQALYHVPAAWLEEKAGGMNRVVLFDELGARWLDHLGELVIVRDLE